MGVETLQSLTGLILGSHAAAALLSVSEDDGSNIFALHRAPEGAAQPDAEALQPQHKRGVSDLSQPLPAAAGPQWHAPAACCLGAHHRGRARAAAARA